MLINELITQDDLLNEVSFKKALGAAALAAGIGYGAGNMTNQVAPLPNMQMQHPNIDTTGFINPNQITKPQDQPEIAIPPAELKKSFILKVKPLIDKQNHQISSDRNFLLSIEGKKLNSEQQSRFNQISKKYGTTDIKQLLIRIDIIPDDLALAQSALESGWGQSHFAKTNAALFGQKASRDSNDFASYDSFQQSIAVYMHNLNTNPAYEKFRSARYYMRKHGDNLNAVLLARTLLAYDQTGKAYTKKIQSMIKHVIPNAERLAMNESVSKDNKECRFHFPKCLLCHKPTYF